MDGVGIPAAKGSDRTRKRTRRRPRTIKLVERDGYWHVHGTILAGGRSVRVRKGLGLSVKAASADEAQVALDAYVDDLKAQATGGKRRGDPVAVAAHAYLTAPRARPLAPAAIRIAKEAVQAFGPRRLNDIDPREWMTWVDQRHKGNTPSSRERFLGGVVAILNFAKKHHGLEELPHFIRDQKARNPNRRARRRVEDLRPDLIWNLLNAAHISLRAQLVVEAATGARVSSVLHGVRVCDLILAKGREQITFVGTKNGEDVNAALTPTAVIVLKDYLKWRGRLHEREEPLFLTYRKKPYADIGKAWGTQNKTGFNAAKRRAAVAIIAAGKAEETRLRKIGQRKAADAARDHAAADADLIGKVTQHWFRHMLATRLLRLDPRAAMDQGGWLDPRSVFGYAMDVPEHRRALVVAGDNLGGQHGSRAEAKIGIQGGKKT